MTIRLVVFDIAGTTVHDGGAVNDCLWNALRTAGVFVDQQRIDAVMGEPKHVAIAKLLGEFHSYEVPPDDDRVREIYACFETMMLAHYERSASVRPADGATEVFRALKADGVRVVLDTGFNRTIVDTLLRRLGWNADGLIDATVTSDEVARGRPSPDLIFKAMQLTGVTDSAEVAKVGDTAADLLEGTAAGCSRVVGITTGSYTRASLATYPHTHLIDHLCELPPLVA